MNHNLPIVGEFYIEKKYYNNSIWTIKITKINSQEIDYKIIHSTNTKSGVVGGYSSTMTYMFNNRFRLLTDNEKIKLL